MSFFLAPEAEEELAEALAFYREQASLSVAAAFLAEFTRVARLIAAHPGIGTPTSDIRRIMPMHRFPYSLVYRVEAEVVRIGAVAHQKIGAPDTGAGVGDPTRTAMTIRCAEWTSPASSSSF